METKNNQAIRDSISETLNNLSVGGVKAFSEKFLPVDNSFLQSTYQQSNYRQFFELSFGLVQIYKNPTHFLAKMHNNLKKVYEKQELLALAPNSIAKTTQVLKEAKVEFDFVNNTLQSAILLIVQRDFSPFTRSQILKILSTDDAKPSTIVKGNNVDGPKNALEEIYEILSSQLPGGIMEYWENEAKNGRISQEILKKIGTEMESCKKSIEERKNKEKMEYVHPKTENSSFIYSSYSPFSSSSSSSVEIVPYKEKIKVRDPSKTVFVGLKNQGATCYLNSLIQSLFMSKPFRRVIYNWKFDAQQAENIINGSGGLMNPKDLEEKCIPLQLQKLLARLNFSIFSELETKNLTKSFGWDASQSFVQHDVQEFMRVLFDNLQMFIPEISSLYEGRMKDYVVCQECGHEGGSTTLFSDLQLTIRGIHSLDAAFQEYVRPENLVDENQYFCHNCRKKVDAVKGLEFVSLPDILCLHLKRFDLDYSTTPPTGIKLNHRVSFPLSLDMSNYMKKKPQSSSTGSMGSDIFNLFSVLIHRGSGTGSGHYFAYIRHGNQWFSFNDETVKEISESELLETFGGEGKSTTNAYLLMYSREVPTSGVHFTLRCKTDEDEKILLPEETVKEIEKENTEALISNLGNEVELSIFEKNGTKHCCKINTEKTVEDLIKTLNLGSPPQTEQQQQKGSEETKQNLANIFGQQIIENENSKEKIQIEPETGTEATQIAYKLKRLDPLLDTIEKEDISLNEKVGDAIFYPKTKALCTKFIMLSKNDETILKNNLPLKLFMFDGKETVAFSTSKSSFNFSSNQTLLEFGKRIGELSSIPLQNLRVFWKKNDYYFNTTSIIALYPTKEITQTILGVGISSNDSIFFENSPQSESFLLKYLEEREFLKTFGVRLLNKKKGKNDMKVKSTIHIDSRKTLDDLKKEILVDFEFLSASDDSNSRFDDKFDLIFHIGSANQFCETFSGDQTLKATKLARFVNETEFFFSVVPKNSSNMNMLANTLEFSEEDQIETLPASLVPKPVQNGTLNVHFHLFTGETMDFDGDQASKSDSEYSEHKTNGKKRSRSHEDEENQRIFDLQLEEMQYENERTFGRKYNTRSQTKKSKIETEKKFSKFRDSRKSDKNDKNDKNDEMDNSVEGVDRSKSVILEDPNDLAFSKGDVKNYELELFSRAFSTTTSFGDLRNYATEQIANLLFMNRKKQQESTADGVTVDLDENEEEEDQKSVAEQNFEVRVEGAETKFVHQKRKLKGVLLDIFQKNNEIDFQTYADFKQRGRDNFVFREKLNGRKYAGKIFFDNETLTNSSNSDNVDVCIQFLPVPEQSADEDEEMDFNQARYQLHFAKNIVFADWNENLILLRVAQWNSSEWKLGKSKELFVPKKLTFEVLAEALPELMELVDSPKLEFCKVPTHKQYSLGKTMQMMSLSFSAVASDKIVSGEPFYLKSGDLLLFKRADELNWFSLHGIAEDGASLKLVLELQNGKEEGNESTSSKKGQYDRPLQFFNSNGNSTTNDRIDKKSTEPFDLDSDSDKNEGSDGATNGSVKLNARKRKSDPNSSTGASPEQKKMKYHNDNTRVS